MARVLIADDATFVRKVMAEMVVAAGHTVVAEAATGDEAVALYDEVRPDIAMLDVNMPGLDGFAAAERIRLTHPSAKIVLASVLMPESRIRQAIALTQVPPLCKPFDAEQLAAALQACEH